MEPPPRLKRGHEKKIKKKFPILDETSSLKERGELRSCLENGNITLALSVAYHQERSSTSDIQIKTWKYEGDEILLGHHHPPPPQNEYLKSLLPRMNIRILRSYVRGGLSLISRGRIEFFVARNFSERIHCDGSQRTR